MGPSESNLVQAYSWDGDSEGVTVRFTGDVTCLQMSRDMLAAGSADMILKVINTLDFTETSLEGHQGSLLSVTLAKQGDYVASSCCDGSVQLWNFNTKVCVRTLG